MRTPTMLPPASPMMAQAWPSELFVFTGAAFWLTVAKQAPAVAPLS